MKDYTDWIQDNTIKPSRSAWNGQFDQPPSDLTLGSEEAQLLAEPKVFNKNKRKVRGNFNKSQTTCTGQDDCAVGFACIGGACVLSTTEDTGASGGCSSGGTGGGSVGGDYGCIQIGGGGNTGGCTTGTCGDLGGDGPGGFEYCCGDWICDADAVTGEVKCRCEPRDYGYCERDEDCAPGEVCTDGFCFTDFCDCDVDSDCPEGYTCSGCFCILDLNPSTCDTDEDCPDGLTCVDGFCGFGPCSDDNDCPEGQECLNGFCSYPSCADDSECEEGYICINGFCVYDFPSFFSCETDEDCDEGYVCIDGYCLFDFPNCDGGGDPCESSDVCIGGFCFPGCQTEVDCESGFECVNGYCSKNCASDEDCQDGQICVNGFCFPGCRTDEDCPEGYECSGGICLPLFDVCTDSFQCNSAESCLNGYCFPGFGVCNKDSDCLENQICINGQCFNYSELPGWDIDLGFDFGDCSAVEAAEDGVVYIADSTIETVCFPVFKPCGGEAASSSTDLVTAGSGYVKNDGVWYQANCYGDGSGIGWPGGGGPGVGGGGGPIPPPPNPLPPGGKRCDVYCQEQFDAGIENPRGCENVPKCGKCQLCKFGLCYDYGDNDDGRPCYCEGAKKCPDCNTCNEQGNCQLTGEDCVKCCEVCTSCPGPDGFPIQLCKTNCVPYDSNEYPCKWPECPDPVEPPCNPCESTSVCGLLTDNLSCPEGYSNTGEIESGDSRCIICEKCDDEKCPPPDPEPCDCNCNDDCGECELCSASTGECEPDPSCDGFFVEYAWYALDSEFQRITQNDCETGTTIYDNGWLIGGSNSGVIGQDPIGSVWVTFDNGIPVCTPDGPNACSNAGGENTSGYVQYPDGSTSGTRVLNRTSCYGDGAFNGNFRAVFYKTGVVVGYGSTPEEAECDAKAKAPKLNIYPDCS